MKPAVQRKLVVSAHIALDFPGKRSIVESGDDSILLTSLCNERVAGSRTGDHAHERAGTREGAVARETTLMRRHPDLDGAAR
jgi:hypothetical protein